MFSCEFCKIFKNAFFYRTPLGDSLDNSIYLFICSYFFPFVSRVLPRFWSSGGSFHLLLERIIKNITTNRHAATKAEVGDYNAQCYNAPQHDWGAKKILDFRTLKTAFPWVLGKVFVCYCLDKNNFDLQLIFSCTVSIDYEPIFYENFLFC